MQLPVKLTTGTAAGGGAAGAAVEESVIPPLSQPNSLFRSQEPAPPAVRCIGKIQRLRSKPYNGTRGTGFARPLGAPP